LGRKKNQASLTELHWVITKQLQEEALSYLFQQDERSFFLPERGFLGVIHSGNGVLRRSLFLRKIIPQEEGWVTWTNHGLSFDPLYFSRALDVVSDSALGAGLILVHSHPGGSINTPPEPSGPDLYHERRLLYHLNHALPVGSPVAAGIVDRSGAWRVREYHWSRPTTVKEVQSRRFGIDSASYFDVSAIRIVSSDATRVYHYGKPDREVNAKTVDSTLRLWGKGGHQILENLRVGIVGLGGVGSILVEYLARLGVGELVLVDFDAVEEENLNRLVGVRRNEVGKPKVEYAARVAREASTAVSFNVRTYRGSASERDGLKHLLDADIIMNAADSAFARQVLDHASYAYAIPVIDGGTTLVVGAHGGEIIGKSQVGQAGPGQPCLECSGAYSQEEATLAREDPSVQGPSSYLRVVGRKTKGEPPRAPSVISYNGLVAALMVQRLLSTVLGFPPRGKSGQQRYYVELGELNWGPTTQCKEDCPKQSWVGLGDSHPVPVGIDPLWKQMRQQKVAIRQARINPRDKTVFSSGKHSPK